MTITLIGCAVILLFAYLGYRRGLLRILAFFAALLIAGLLAMPLAPFARPLCDGARFIPQTLIPVAAPLAAGLTVFIVFSVVTGWLLRRRERSREAQNLPPTEAWQRLAGALFGALWGVALYILVLAGLHLLGNVERALVAGANPPPASPPREGKPAAQVEKPAGEPRRTQPQVEPATAPDEKQPSRYGAILDQIDASPFAPAVRTVNPAEDKIARIFADLATVTGDDVLLARFQQHPAIHRLTARPELLEVAQDNQIRLLVEEHRYYELLDHPKLAALLKDREFVAECRKVDLAAVLDEVLGRENPTPPAGRRLSH